MIVRQALKLGVREVYSSQDIALAPETQVVVLKIYRPTLAQDRAWDVTSTLKVTLSLIMDEEVMPITGQATGGRRILKDGTDLPAYLLKVKVPKGPQGVRNGPITSWGQRAKTKFAARIDVEAIGGNADTEIELEAT